VVNEAVQLCLYLLLCIMGMGHTGVHFTGAFVQGYNSILCKLDASFDDASCAPAYLLCFWTWTSVFEWSRKDGVNRTTS
jgi:hypothetical protein